MVADKRFMCTNLRGAWSSDRNINIIRYTRISVSTDIDEERFMVLKHTIGHLMVKFVYPAWVLFFSFLYSNSIYLPTAKRTEFKLSDCHKMDYGD